MGLQSGRVLACLLAGKLGVLPSGVTKRPGKVSGRWSKLFVLPVKGMTKARSTFKPWVFKALNYDAVTMQAVRGRTE